MIFWNFWHLQRFLLCALIQHCLGQCWVKLNDVWDSAQSQQSVVRDSAQPRWTLYSVQYVYRTERSQSWALSGTVLSQDKHCTGQHWVKAERCCEQSSVKINTVQDSTESKLSAVRDSLHESHLTMSREGEHLWCTICTSEYRKICTTIHNNF